MHPVVLTGPRVSWRELSLDDAEAIVDLMSDERVFRYALDTEMPDVTVYRAFLSEYADTVSAADRTRYKLALTVDGRVIGTGGVEMRHASASYGEIGYMIHPDMWGKGFGTEAAALLVGFAFDQLKLHRVWAGADPANVASTRILEKIGMRYEGTHREDTFKDGKWRDSAVYAILETDPRPFG